MNARPPMLHLDAEEEMFLVLEGKVEVCEYPDSGKFGADSGYGSSRMRHLTRAADARDHGENE